VIDVILPALNEADAIPGVLAAMPAGYAPVVVDNGSTDGTSVIAARNGARVVHEPCQGFGAACFAGLQAARSELVCFMDCDGSLDPSELPRVVAQVERGHADLVLGARRPEPGAWPLHARAGNRIIAAQVRRQTRAPLTDLGPMRCASRTGLLALGLTDRAFGWPLEMVLAAARAGWRIDEVAVTYRARAGGRSKVTGSVRGTWRATRDMGALLRRP
jgi:glycosyltransferase involved in cell wall biosynthesis